ncbi:VTT domain-containing protein [Deinococcus sp. QL22]|uniref:VTT domain-containing protein n=1 Tax=Deinococcus sp. QL22 TaxID=2939437 RepID=UPI00201781DD|nr:VTT domain-containing protein [Deinococcus sp. QL22]UQN09124.1 VTT domain-containing protein [Deinococcus sp. QL22]
MLVATLLTFFLLLFVVVEAFQLPLLTNPTPLLQHHAYGALLSVTLLIADVVLPVPSSLIMVANGALYGALLGATLSLVGTVGATLLGYFLGKRGTTFLTRNIPLASRLTAQRLLQRWGLLAIIVTRPVPLLAETTAILAGTSELRWTSVALAAAAGALPPALLYAAAGAATLKLQSSVIIFATVIALAGLVWLTGYAVQRYLTRRTAPHRS